MNIKDKLQKIDKDYFDLLKKVGVIASKSGFKVYLVGGMVRDILLGMDNLDIDITVESDAIKFANELVHNLSNCQLEAKHEKFNTAKVIFDIKDKTIPIDLATTREEIYKFPGALPEVSTSTLEKDLVRRDFSINALAVSLLPDDFGRIIDLFNGLEDLKNKKIKILHDKSFIDDPTRMIRAIRFSVRLGFHIEEKTNNLLNEAIKSGKFDNLIKTLRGDRIKIEIRYLFNLKNLEESIHAFFQSEIYKMISTKLSEPFDIKDTLPFPIDNNEDHSSSLIKLIRIRQWIISLGILLKNLSEEDRSEIMKNLQLTSEEIKCIDSGLSKYKALKEENLNLDRIIIYNELYKLPSESILIVRTLFKNEKNIIDLIDDFLLNTSKIELKITGTDLAAIGISQGKMIGDVLKKVLEKKILNPKMTRDDEIKEVFRLVESKN